MCVRVATGPASDGSGGQAVGTARANERSARVARCDYGRLMMDEPWDDPDDDRELPRSSSGAYPLPEATIAGHETFLAGLAAAILGVLLFWRRKRPAEEDQ